MKRFSRLLVMALVAIPLFVLSGCGFGTPEEECVQYIPFQSEENGDWGLISPSGEVLFSAEFKHMPSIATCDRFWAENDQGYYELYTTEAVPKTVIDTEYRYVTTFYNDRAIVAERDKPMSIINTKGETMVSLEKIDGVAPDNIFGFNEGAAVFTTDTVMGMINLEGEVIIPAKYFNVQPMYSGKVVAFEKGFFTYGYDQIPDSVIKGPESIARVFDKKGKEIMKISSKDYPSIGSRWYGKHLPVAKNLNGEYAWGIINEKGEEVFKPRKKIRLITEIQDDKFVFVNDEMHMGVMDLKGNVIIRPEYNYITFVADDLMEAMKYDEGDDESIENRLINMKGETINKGDYQFITHYIPQAKLMFFKESKFAVAKIRENHFTIIDKEAKRIEGLPKIYNIYYYEGYSTNSFVRSDYIDIPKLLKDINFTATSLDGMDIRTTTPRSALDRQARYYSASYQPEASNYSYQTSVSIYRTIEGEGVNEIVNFPGSLSSQTYYQEKVIDYVGYYYTYYHYNYIPTGYKFNDYTPTSFELRFDNYGKLRGKLKLLYKDLVAKFKKMGTEVASNKNAAIFRLPNDEMAIIYLEDHNVVAKWGDIYVSSSDIDRYEYNKEKLSVD